MVESVDWIAGIADAGAYHAAMPGAVNVGSAIFFLMATCHYQQYVDVRKD